MFKPVYNWKYDAMLNLEILYFLVYKSFIYIEIGIIYIYPNI